jgi:competence protein ComEA
MDDWLEKHRDSLKTALSVVVVGTVLAGGALLIRRKPQPAPIVISTLATMPAPSLVPTATQAPILAYVTGAVAHPGVYALPQDSRIENAIAAAGGATSDANMLAINLAERVHDAQQIYVPYQSDTATPILPTPMPTAASVSTGSSGSQRVNINSASVSELETLPGIGPALAQRIIDYRVTNGPFNAPEDIINVRGIGEQTFQQLRDLITVR